jgi:hypothetical protein
MNPKTGIPEIKPEVNKEKGNDRSKGGFFARLFGAGEAGGSLAGSAVDIGGAAAGGGLLATKAGLIALLLAGSTVAAGIGLIGYRVFGPGQDSGDNNYALFAPKPKQAPAAPTVAPGSQDGTSQSLSMLNQANVDGTAKSGAADAALKDQAAADASAASANGGANVANTAMSDSGPSAPKTISAAKLPPLAGFGSSGGMPTGGSSASAGGPQKIDAAKSGVMGSMASKGTPGASRATAASAHAGHSNGAMGQAFGVLGNQAGGRAGSSFAAGQTYDGSATTGASSIGPSAGAPTAGGQGAGSSQTAAKSTPNTAMASNQIQPPPTPASTEVTPWKGDIDAARALIAVAVVLLLVRRKIAAQLNKIQSVNDTVALKVIDGIIAAVGLAVIALGARISGGIYGQVTQGGVLAAAGAGIILSSVGSVFTTDGLYGTTDDPSVTNSTILGGLNLFTVIGGGAALVGLAASMLQPPKTYPSSQFNNGVAPGQGAFSMGRMPSQDAFRRLS